MRFLDQKNRLFHRKIQNNTASNYLTEAAFLFILRSTYIGKKKLKNF